MAGAVVEQVEGLVRDLRRAGVGAGVAHVVEACSALGHVDIGSREQVRLALRCTLVKRVEDEAVFDALFERRFAVRRAAAPVPAGGGGGGGGGGGDEQDLLDRIVDALAAGDDPVLAELADEAAARHGGLDTANGSDRYHLQRTLRALRPDTLAHDALRRRRGDVPRRDEGVERADRAEIQARLDRFLAALAGATRRQSEAPEESDDEAPYLRVEDIAIADASVVELRRLRRAVRPLARRLAARIARRRQRPQGALDVRRTIRRSLAAGGVPLDPTFRRRQPHRADLWLLCDVSGSVAEFARFTIGLLTAIHDEVPRLRSFLFVDDVVEVTGLLAARTHDVDPFALVGGAGAPLGGRQSDWGAALSRFHDDHGGRLTRRSTIVITGDARTHGRDPRAPVVRELVRRTRGVWLLDPEPRDRWSDDDAVVDDYRRAGAHVLEVRTLAQLAGAVEHIVAPGR